LPLASLARWHAADNADCHDPGSAVYNKTSEGFATVTRSNLLYLIVGALVIAVAVMGYQLYQDRHQPEGLDIKVGPGGLSIQGK
jgi:hypothetical protein